jgi:hypothetical protein
VSAPVSAPAPSAATATTTTPTPTTLTGQQAHAALDALAPRLSAQDWRARAAAAADLASPLLPSLPAGAALGRGLDALAQRLTDANTRVSIAAMQVRESDILGLRDLVFSPFTHAQLRLPPPGFFSCPQPVALLCAPTAVVRGRLCATSTPAS